jgi:nucleoside-diphosphate-sugar epimerase
MRVLVTGATSDTGRLLCDRLLARGHTVVCFAREPVGLAGEVLAEVGQLPEPGEDWGENGERFDAAVEGCALVHHVAHIRYAPAVVSRARVAGVMRTICVTSARRFTQWPDLAARQVIRAEEELAGDPEGWVALRATMIYGGAHSRNVTRLVDLVRRWPVIALPGGGRRRIQPLFIEDLVDAILAASHAQGVAGRVVDVAGPEPIPVREAVGIIARELGLRRLTVPIPLGPAVLLARLAGPDSLARVRRLGEDRTRDISEARALLDFNPRPFAEGLRAWLGRGISPGAGVRIVN